MASENRKCDDKILAHLMWSPVSICARLCPSPQLIPVVFARWKLHQIGTYQPLLNIARDDIVRGMGAAKRRLYCGYCGYRGTTLQAPIHMGGLGVSAHYCMRE